MIVLTVQMYYNIFAVLWSTMSILMSGPVYFQIERYGGSGSLCYYPNPTLRNAKEDNTIGTWQNKTECLFCSYTQYEEISSHDGELSQDEVQLFCAVNVTLYGPIALGDGKDEGAKNLQPYAYKHDHPLAVLTITTFLHIAQNPTPMSDLSISGHSAFALLVSNFGILDFSSQLGKFQNFDLSSHGKEIAVHTPQVSLLTAIFNYMNDTIHASNNISEVINEDANCSMINDSAIQAKEGMRVESMTNEQLMNEYANCSLIDNNAFQGEGEKVKVTTNEQLMKEDTNYSLIVDNAINQGKGENMEPMTNVGLSVRLWMCLVYIVLMGIVNGISCFMNKKMSRQIKNEIATCQVLQQKLDKVNLTVRTQAKTLTETVEHQEKAKKMKMFKSRRAAILDKDGLLCNYTALQVNAKRRAFLAESMHFKRNFKYLRGKMKNSTLQLKKMGERRKRTLLAKEKCLRKKNRCLKLNLETAQNVTRQIEEQLNNGQKIIQDTLQSKKSEEEERIKLLQETLEAEIKKANEKVAKLIDERRSVEEKLKAANAKIKSIEMALEDTNRQLEINILSMRNELDDYKVKLAETIAQPSKPPEVPASSAKPFSMMASLRKRFNQLTCSSTPYKADKDYHHDVKAVNNDANGDGAGLPVDFCISSLVEDKKNV